jgi:hypothetical protein
MMPALCPQCDHPASLDAATAAVCARCGAQLDAMPGIDISQLATLDERGVDVAGRPPSQAFAPPQARAPSQALAPPQAFAPPPHAVAPQRDAFAPPPDAFGPASDDADQPLGVERSTRAIRIENEWQLQRAEKQAAAAEPLPAPRRSIGGLVIAIGLIAAVAIGLVVVAMQPKAPPSTPRPGVASQPASR